MELTDEHRDTISVAIYNIAKKFVENNIPFALVVDNHNNWDQSLPPKLKDKGRFALKIEKQTLEDSTVLDNSIQLITIIDSIEYSIKLKPWDIHSISCDITLPPFISKPFIEYPQITSKNIGYKRDEAGIRNSNLIFKKNNPHLFEED